MSTFEPVREHYGSELVDLRNGSAGYCSAEEGPEKPPIGFLTLLAPPEDTAYHGKQH